MKIAPSLPTAIVAITVSTSIGRKMPTRSPVPTPSAASAPASRLASSWTSR